MCFFYFIAEHDDEKITPSLWGTVAGGSITFTCDAVEDIRWFVKVLHKNSDEPLWQSRFFTIGPLTLMDSGYYYCYGRYKTKNAHFLSRARLKVYGM